MLIHSAARSLPRTAAAPLDQPLQLADRLIDSYGVRSQTGLLFRENLATHLYHAVGTRGVRALLQSSAPLTIDGIRAHTQKMAAARWMIKVERDLRSPYQDADVFERLDQLSQRFQKEIVQLRQWSHGQQFRILVNGSLCKGRMGKNSDIDGQVDTQDAAFRDRLLHLFQTTPHDTISFYPLSEGGEGRAEEHISGPLLDLGDGGALLADPHYLTTYYMGVMRRKGYTIDASLGTPRVTGYTPPGKRRREVNLVLEKFFDKSRTDVQGNEFWQRMKHWSFRTAGNMLPLPGVGPVVGWCLEKLAPSDVR